MRTCFEGNPNPLATTTVTTDSDPSGVGWVVVTHLTDETSRKFVRDELEAFAQWIELLRLGLGAIASPEYPSPTCAMPNLVPEQGLSQKRSFLRQLAAVLKICPVKAVLLSQNLSHNQSLNT